MFKKALRFFFFVIFIVLASFGLGVGNLLYGNKERYLDTEIKIEQTDKRDEDYNESDEEKN